MHTKKVNIYNPNRRAVKTVCSHSLSPVGDKGSETKGRKDCKDSMSRKSKLSKIEVQVREKSKMPDFIQERQQSSRAEM